MTVPWVMEDERRGWAGYLPLTTCTYLLPDGSRADWDIFGRDRAVAVLALTDDREVVLSRQFRPGPGRVLDELPGGYVEPHENVLEAAARELLEETGYAGDLELAGTSWMAAACRTLRHVVVATRVRQVADPSPECGEFCEVVLMALPEFRHHLRSGQLTDVDLGYLALDHLGSLSA
jgi:ADP-ribose pyrophosphatase